jgi:hypothetical protein
MAETGRPNGAGSARLPTRSCQLPACQLPACQLPAYQLTATGIPSV